MKWMVGILICLGAALYSQDAKPEFVSKAQPGAVIEHFTLTGGRVYDGIWDATKSQIHIVVRTNHVGNLPLQPAEILTQKRIGDGSQVGLYSDLDMAEKVLLLNQQNCKAAQLRLATAQQRRDALHQTYGHKDLPRETYNAVMAQYKAADDEIANAEKAVENARAGFAKSQEAYVKVGGKKQYTLP
jgi:hypothetical protein